MRKKKKAMGKLFGYPIIKNNNLPVETNITFSDLSSLIQVKVKIKGRKEIYCLLSDLPENIQNALLE